MWLQQLLINFNLFTEAEARGDIGYYPEDFFEVILEEQGLGYDISQIKDHFKSSLLETIKNFNKKATKQRVLNDIKYETQKGYYNIYIVNYSDLISKKNNIEDITVIKSTMICLNNTTKKSWSFLAANGNTIILKKVLNKLIPSSSTNDILEQL